jgi:hypothetical protein
VQISFRHPGGLVDSRTRGVRLRRRSRQQSNNVPSIHSIPISTGERSDFFSSQVVARARDDKPLILSGSQLHDILLSILLLLAIIIKGSIISDIDEGSNMMSHPEVAEDATNKRAAVIGLRFKKAADITKKRNNLEAAQDSNRSSCSSSSCSN